MNLLSVYLKSFQGWNARVMCMLLDRVFTDSCHQFWMRRRISKGVSSIFLQSIHFGRWLHIKKGLLPCIPYADPKKVGGILCCFSGLEPKWYFDSINIIRTCIESCHFITHTHTLKRCGGLLLLYDFWHSGCKVNGVTVCLHSYNCSP